MGDFLKGFSGKFKYFPNTWRYCLEMKNRMNEIQRTEDEEVLHGDTSLLGDK